MFEELNTNILIEIKPTFFNFIAHNIVYIIYFKIINAPTVDIIH